jgi:hypothetical protein
MLWKIGVVEVKRVVEEGTNSQLKGTCKVVEEKTRKGREKKNGVFDK